MKNRSQSASEAHCGPFLQIDLYREDGCFFGGSVRVFWAVIRSEKTFFIAGCGSEVEKQQIVTSSTFCMLQTECRCKIYIISKPFTWHGHKTAIKKKIGLDLVQKYVERIITFIHGYLCQSLCNLSIIISNIKRSKIQLQFHEHLALFFHTHYTCGSRYICKYD